jgi:hypothetical protein
VVQRRVRVTLQAQGEGSARYESVNLSVIFEQMTPMDVHRLIVEAAGARLHRLTKRARRGKSECTNPS